jgi:hypothetical protein
MIDLEPVFNFLFYASLTYLCIGPMFGFYNLIKYLKGGAPFGAGIGLWFFVMCCIPLVNLPHLWTVVEMIWYNGPIAEFYRRKAILNKRI